MKRLMMIVTGLFIATTCFGGEIYKWIDDQGKLHFGDKKPQQKSTEEVKLKINTYTSVSYNEASFDSGDRVVIYTTPGCTYCKKAKQYFSSHNIAYTEYDISRDINARKRFRDMGGRGVPVILVGKKRMNGFSVAGFERIYQ